MSSYRWWSSLRPWVVRLHWGSLAQKSYVVDDRIPKKKYILAEFSYPPVRGSAVPLEIETVTLSPPPEVQRELPFGSNQYILLLQRLCFVKPVNCFGKIFFTHFTYDTLLKHPPLPSKCFAVTDRHLGQVQIQG